MLSGRARGLVSLALEAWLVSRVVALDRKGDHEAREYRDLAYSVARQSFSSIRRDGPFEYYETMEKFIESGQFDLDPGTGFVPETDTSTFNGSLWLLARRTFFADPDVPPPSGSAQLEAAEAFYRERAITHEFRWSWRNAQLEQDVFRGSIRSSDDAYRQRTNFLGVLVLNHLVSAIDAFVTARGRRPAAMPQVDIGPDEASFGWTVRF